jgi:hypothetical protein
MPQVGRDLEFDDDGDIVVDDTGDVKLATAERTVIQDVEFRVRTDHLDFAPNSALGANLIAIRGQPNKRLTGSMAKEQIYYSLIKDGRFPRNSLFVDVVPVGRETIAAFIFVQDYIEGMSQKLNAYDSSLIVGFNISLDVGLISRITGPKE